MDLPLWDTDNFVAVTLKHNRSLKIYGIGNHVLLLSAFLATFPITTLYKNSRRKNRVFRSPYRKLNIFAIFRSDCAKSVEVGISEGQTNDTQSDL